MRSSWRSVANAAASARAAAHAAWPRPPPIPSTTSCPSNRSASGCCRSRTRYGSCSRHAPRCSPKSWVSSTERSPPSSSVVPDCAWALAPALAPSPSSNASTRLSLNIHLHMLFVDGVYTFDDERPRLHRGCAPTQTELQRLLRTIATRVSRALESQGLLIRDDETPSLDLEPDDGFEQLLGAAVHYRIATGPHAGRKALTLHTVATRAPTHIPCIAQLSGFSLHSPPEWCNRGLAPCAIPTGAAPSNACVATSPARHSPTNASRSMNGDRSSTDSSTPSVTGPLTSSSTPSISCATSVCRTPSGQPPAVPIGNPADLASPALPRWSHDPAPTSPDTTACSPRTSGTATTSSPTPLIKAHATLTYLQPRLRDARAGPRMVRGAADSADCGDTRRYRPGARQPVHAPETCERVRVSLQVRLLTE